MRAFRAASCVVLLCLASGVAEAKEAEVAKAVDRVRICSLIAVAEVVSYRDFDQRKLVTIDVKEVLRGKFPLGRVEGVWGTSITRCEEHKPGATLEQLRKCAPPPPPARSRIVVMSIGGGPKNFVFEGAKRRMLDVDQDYVFDASEDLVAALRKKIVEADSERDRFRNRLTQKRTAADVLAAVQKAAPKALPLVPKDPIAELSAWYRLSTGLESREYCLLPDRSYFYTESADIMRPTIYDKGAWSIEDGMIRLDSDFKEAPRHEVALLPLTVSGKTVLFGRDLAYTFLTEQQEKKGGDGAHTFEFWAFPKGASITAAEAPALKEKLMKERWRPDFFKR